MSQEIDYGVKTFDFATDSTQEFVNGVAGVTDSNMHKLTNAIKNKVTLNGQASDQQNFNFIENKVEQNGLQAIVNAPNVAKDYSLGTGLTIISKVKFNERLTTTSNYNYFISKTFNDLVILVFGSGTFYITCMGNKVAKGSILNVPKLKQPHIFTFLMDGSFKFVARFDYYDGTFEEISGTLSNNLTHLDGFKIGDADCDFAKHSGQGSKIMLI